MRYLLVAGFIRRRSRPAAALPDPALTLVPAVDLIAESLQSHADAAAAAALRPQEPDVEWLLHQQLREPYGPDRAVFGPCLEPVGYPATQAPHTVACSACKAQWRGRSGQRCWACPDGTGEIVY